MPDSGITLSAYAARRGVSKMSVSKAVSTGRLVASVGRTESGRPCIVNVELADLEWARNTNLIRARPDTLAQHEAFKAAVAGVVTPAAPPVTVAPAAPQIDSAEDSLHEANRREKWARARLAELKLEHEAGQLVEAATVEAKLTEVFTRCKTKLLGVPSRVRQQDPSLTVEQVEIVKKAIREALEDLAGGES